ncbi:MAG: Ribonuclease P protein component [Parcubacteria group bacterium Gr01-1014_13]|nr:MAG: Ribonuclease P protein component [Parcubacteria group bacterium Gr01-1014_13]
MLQQDNRLRKLRDFNLVMKHGQWVNGRFLDIKVLELAKNQNFFPKKEDPESFKKQLKLAIAAGLKVHKSAVKRNRVRRQIREAIRLLIKDNLLKIGFYVLIVAKKEVLDKNYAEISAELKLLLSRGKVLKA